MGIERIVGSPKAACLGVQGIQGVDTFNDQNPAKHWRAGRRERSEGSLIGADSAQDMPCTDLA